MSGRWHQGKRDSSKSNTKSPASRSPPNKKTDEGAGRKESNTNERTTGDLSLVEDATLSPITKGLLKRPDLWKVPNIQASTPTKSVPENTSDAISSPIFRKTSNNV